MAPTAPTKNSVASCWALLRSDWADEATSPMTVSSELLTEPSWSMAALTATVLLIGV